MKSTLVRLLALATLATSMSAFAATEKPKHDDANSSATTQQNGCATDAKTEKKQKKAKQTQQENQEDQDYARFLMGTYG